MTLGQLDPTTAGLIGTCFTSLVGVALLWLQGKNARELAKIKAAATETNAQMVENHKVTNSALDRLTETKVKVASIEGRLAGAAEEHLRMLPTAAPPAVIVVPPVAPHVPPAIPPT